MTRPKCPSCGKGKLYEGRTEDGYTERSCYVCGYYWDSSEGYDELTVRLHKEYFPREVAYRPSAEFRHLADSAEEWTKPPQAILLYL